MGGRNDGRGDLRSRSGRAETISDRLDRVLTHRWLGPLIFAALMLLIFQAVFNGAVWFMDSIEFGLAQLSDLIAARVPDGAVQSLLISGVIGGVGSVLVFLPQIFILFFFIALLEDCGYMARAAFLMDRLMTRVGLSGKSFIPLLSSFACAVPGIMATRVIENRRDRLVTILIAPLMTCSARLPVYVLLIAAFIPRKNLLPALNLFGWQWSMGLQDVTMAGLYLLGHRRRDRRRVDLEANDSTGRNASVRDGVAQLQDCPTCESCCTACSNGPGPLCGGPAR